MAAGPEVEIMDDKGELLENNEVGEIVIRGDNVTPGYENNPEANEKSFTNGWFLCGVDDFAGGLNHRRREFLRIDQADLHSTEAWSQ